MSGAERKELQMSSILHQERDASGLNLIISVDDDPIDPRREYDHLGTMVCWHRRYKLGDQHLFGSPGEFEMEMEERPHIKLPIFLYDHSGLTLSTAPYACPWDSGQIGWILVEWHRLRTAFPKLGRRSKLQAQADALLRAELRSMTNI